MRSTLTQIERQNRRLLRLRLSALFYQECTVKDGAIEQTNFDSYDPMRITFSN
jgi:isoquinoline 1-oxidoreductase beta subunit